MKLLLVLFSASLCGLCLPFASSAAEFQNLGFDDVDTTGLGTDADPAKVLPGWKLLRDGEPYPSIDINPQQVENTWVALSGRQRFGAFVEGRLALFFVRYEQNSPVWSLEQTGTIPAGTKYLTYRSAIFRMEVQINDEVIPPLDWELPPFDWTLPGRGPNPIYDVSAYAGQEVKLAFVGPFGPCSVFDCGVIAYMDSITFLDDVPKITAIEQSAPGAKTNEVTLHFTPIPGRTMRVEFRDELSRGGVWTALPSSPSTPGIIVDKTPAEPRFYRLRVDVPWLP